MRKDHGWNFFHWGKFIRRGKGGPPREGGREQPPDRLREGTPSLNVKEKTWPCMRERDRGRLPVSTSSCHDPSKQTRELWNIEVLPGANVIQEEENGQVILFGKSKRYQATIGPREGVVVLEGRSITTYPTNLPRPLADACEALVRKLARLFFFCFFLFF